MAVGVAARSSVALTRPCQTGLYVPPLRYRFVRTPRARLLGLWHVSTAASTCSTCLLQLHVLQRAGKFLARDVIFAALAQRVLARRGDVGLLVLVLRIRVVPAHGVHAWQRGSAAILLGALLAVTIDG